MGRRTQVVPPPVPSKVQVLLSHSEAVALDLATRFSTASPEMIGQVLLAAASGSYPAPVTGSQVMGRDSEVLVTVDVPVGVDAVGVGGAGVASLGLRLSRVVAEDLHRQLESILARTST